MKRDLLWISAVLLIAAVLFSMVASSLYERSSETAVCQLEETLRKAAAACYAADGVYPMNLADLEERCGVQINRERYAVHYEIFAANHMPAITVLEKNQ